MTVQSMCSGLPLVAAQLPTCQPASFLMAGSTTRLKVTMLLTGLPGRPNTSRGFLHAACSCWMGGQHACGALHRGL